MRPAPSIVGQTVQLIGTEQNPGEWNEGEWVIVTFEGHNILATYSKATGVIRFSCCSIEDEIVTLFVPTYNITHGVIDTATVTSVGCSTPEDYTDIDWSDVFVYATGFAGDTIDSVEPTLNKPTNLVGWISI